MSIINRWGNNDPAKAAFFKRQIEYRKTMNTILEEDGSKIIAENSLAFKPSTLVKSPEDLVKMIYTRVVRPVMSKGDPVLPQMVGVNVTKNECYVYFYAPILKEFNGKVSGLVDVLTALLGNKECDLTAFITGAKGGRLGHIGVAAAYDMVQKSTFRRAWKQYDTDVSETQIPLELYEQIFSRTFDVDIWTEKEAWIDIN